MKIGTKSVLFGAHQFAIHPWFVALGWWKLFGFPWDPRLWVAFFVHDLGYIGKPNMDGPEGETHPILGATIMHWFDRDVNELTWMHLSLLHSRYYAKSLGLSPSKLCFADKLSFALTPRWLYLPMVRATGELTEYLRNAQKADSANWKPTGYDAKVWHAQLCTYMKDWVDKHKDGSTDTWTPTTRHAKDASGVTR